MIARRAVLISVPFTAALALVGCSLSRSAPREKPETTLLGAAGRLVTPRRCQLDVVILTRPKGDPALDDLIWRVADEQVLDNDLRRTLQANGLRVGRVLGDLPPEVEALLHAKPPDQPSKIMIQHPEGMDEQIDPTEGTPRPELTLLVSHPDGKVSGESYKDVHAVIRLTGSYDENDGVSLRLVPEIHHGPNRKSYGMVPTTGLPTVREFRITNGQDEKTFSELAATLDLQPDQIAVVGAAGGRPGSLGEILFCRPDGQSDRVLQSVVLIWAARTESTPRSPTSGEPPPVLVPIDLDDLSTRTEPETTPESLPNKDAISGGKGSAPEKN